MKNILLILISLFLFANTKADMLVSGKLADNVNLDGRIHKVILTDSKERITLVNEYVEADNCTVGSYEVVEVREGVFALKNIIDCDEVVDAPSKVVACPEIHMPICAEVSADKFGNKSLRQQMTFPNGCEMYRAKAAFIANGECF